MTEVDGKPLPRIIDVGLAVTAGLIAMLVAFTSPQRVQLQRMRIERDGRTKSGFALRASRTT